MKLFLTFLIIFFIFDIHFSFAQVPVIEWQRSLGSNKGDHAYSIKPTTDGGYIISGFTESDGGDVIGYHGPDFIGDCWIIKLNSAGIVQWQKCLGGFNFETWADIQLTPDGGYIVGGSSRSDDCNITGNHGGVDYWIVKLTAKGDIEWQKQAGGSKNDYAYRIELAVDGGYIIAGQTESTDGDVTVNKGNNDYWIVKLDQAGNLQWEKSFGGSNDDMAYSLRATADGGCVVAGYSESNDGDVTGNHGGRDFWIVKLSNTGNLQWQKSLGGSGYEEAWSIQLTNDGGYIATGYTNSIDGDVTGLNNTINTFQDYWVVKLNSTGVLQWQKCYGSEYNDLAFYIHNTTDGGYVIAGTTESSTGDVTCANSGGSDIWLIKINNTGTIEWQKAIGGNYDDLVYCIQALPDGSFVVAGATCSSDIPGYHPLNTTNLGSCADFWIVKLSRPLLTKPNATVTIVPPPSGKPCSGIPATFYALTNYAGLTPTYRWERNNIPVGTNSPTYTASDFSNNEILACNVTNAGDCDANFFDVNSSVVVKTNTNAINPQISITADNTFICECTRVTFTPAIINGGTKPVYQWQVNGINTGVSKEIFTINTLKEGDIVSCILSDTAGCVTNGFVISNAIQMQRGSNLVPSISIAPSANTVCIGTEITFTAITTNAGTNPAYQWKVNGINAGADNKNFVTSTLVNNDIVSCTITTDPLFKCAFVNTVTSNNISMIITNRVTPLVTITASANSICTGSSVVFTALPANAGANPSYQWKVNGINTGLNSKTFTTAGLKNGDIVNCALTADPVFSCVNLGNVTSDNIVMTVTSQVSPSVTITSSGNGVCFGETITFNAVAQNAGISPSYQWNLNGIGAGNNLSTYSNNSLFNGDELSCIVTPGNDVCSGSPVLSNSIFVVINELPVINISPADTIISAGSQIRLTTTVAGSIKSYQWNPSDQLENASQLNPVTSHLSGNTTYTLTVENNKGCKASATATVKIFTAVYIPKAFTPNNDGLNDIFRIPPGILFRLNEFSIYNRWGNKVFTTKDINKGWDGTLNSKVLDSGAYVYIIKGSDDKGNVFLKGNVVLIK